MILNNYIDVDDKKLKLLEEFYDLHKNAKLNLTSIKDKDDFYLKHYLDSVYIFKIRNLKPHNLLDVGTGGGFPGIALAIFYPEVNFVLVESKKKKCSFLENAVTQLNLFNVKILNERVENLKGFNFDFITARGVAKTLDLLKMTIGVSRETTTWIFYKGEKIKEELIEAKKYLIKNKMKVENVRIETPFKRTYTIITFNNN